MIACKQCESMNSLDGAFCKKCGASLPEDELKEGLAKLDELAKEGFHLFTEGRTEEARMVAESALLTHPNHAEALSLKGMCHEREGHVAEALECFERVVELKPDSTLDKIKVTQLRNRLAAPVPEPAPNRTLALAGAVATVALVIALGALFGSINVSARDKTVAKQTPTVDPGLGSAMPPVRESAGIKDAPAEKPTQDPPLTVDPGAGQGVPPVRPNGGGIQVPSYDGTGLPNPADQGNKPITLDVRGIDNQNPGAKTDPPKQNEDPPPVDVETKQEPKPIMEMTIVSGGGTRTAGGSEPVASGQGAKALLEAANAKFTMGRYAEAVQAYQSALGAGARPGSTNQRLADCYKHLGQRDAAVAAYTRAAKAHEESGNARAADVCRQAIRDLGG